MKKLFGKILFIPFLIFIFVVINYASNFIIFDIINTLYQPHNFKGLIKSSIYTATYFFVFINLICILFMKNGILFKILMIFLYITFTIDIVYFFIDRNGVGFSIHQIIIAFNEISHFNNAIIAYCNSILISAFIVIALMIFVLYFRKIISLRFSYLPIIMMPLSFVSSYQIYQKSAYAASEYPAFIKIPIYLYSAYKGNYLDIPFAERDSLNVYPTYISEYKNIILIVDESVRSDYLSINNFDKKTTPFLDQYKNVVTLGNVSSCANNSAPSQYIIRNGLQLSDLPDSKFNTLTYPSIFQYAKNAGFNTYYLDSQVEYGQFQNYMSVYDLSSIDEYFTIKDRKPFYNLDRKLVGKIKSIMDGSSKNFIYIVKYGSHVPWIINYPPENTFFSPVLDSFESVNFDNRKRAINTYLNSLRWGVDEFFRELLSSISFRDAIIVYTSDHGINIAENNTVMHYGMEKNPPITSATVPILIFANNIQNKYKFSKDIYSHFMIFPSLLHIMGYDKNVYSKYNHSFFDLDISDFNSSRYFFSGNIFGNGYINNFQ